MMISKFAVQSGLGVTVVGGGIGIAVWKLKKTPSVSFSKTDDAKNHEMDSQSSNNSSDDPDALDGTNVYLVKVPESANVNNQPTEELTEKIGEKNKNYFCQWDTKNNEKKDDKNCIIQQIQFDANKKVVFLSTIMAEFNNTSNSNSRETTTLTKNNLKNKQNWFFLKITGYKFELTTTVPHIDIVSSSEGDDKKYTTVTPKLKLENNKITQGKTKTFLVKSTKNKTNEKIKDFKCKWNNETAQECYVYKFGTQPTPIDQSITEISLDNAIKLTDTVENNNYYIISFKKNTELKTISSLNTNSATIIVVEKKDNPNQIVGEFTVINPMIGKVDNSKIENLILLN